MSDLDRARDALWSIPFDEQESEFFRTLCAAADAGLDEQTVRDWAAQWPRFNESQFRAHWKGAVLRRSRFFGQSAKLKLTG